MGGGVAASAAALTLAKSGRRIASIAPLAQEGDRVGESLSPAGVAELDELGLTAAFAAGPHRVSNAIYSSWGSALLAQASALANAAGAGFVLDRPAFDRMLRAASEHSGIATIEDAVVHAESSIDGWRLTLADGAHVTARFVIDGSGRAAVAARSVGVRRRADRLVAAYACISQSCNEVEPTPATLIEAVENGWWYAALLPDRRLSLAFFTDPDSLPRGITRNAPAWAEMAARAPFVQRWLESASYPIVQAPLLASAGTTWLEPIAGENWAAVGDAAAAFDPLSSHGLTTALWSGRRAALATIAALDGVREPLVRYALDFHNAVHSVVAQRIAVYGRERRFADEPFWIRRRP